MGTKNAELSKARTLQAVIFAFGGVSIAFAVVAPKLSIWNAIALYALLNLIVTNSIVFFLVVCAILKNTIKGSKKLTPTSRVMSSWSARGRRDLSNGADSAAGSKRGGATGADTFAGSKRGGV